MLLTLATLAHASAKDDREAYAVFDNGTLTFYCDNQKATHSGAMPLNEGNAVPDWNNNASDITTVVFSESFQYASPKSCYSWFYECENLTEIKGIQYLNTSEVTNMSNMFKLCYVLQSLDLSSFNTAHVTDMSYMFSFSLALKTILVGNDWSVRKVTSSDNMFLGCENLVGGEGFGYNDNNANDQTNANTGDEGYLTSLEQCTPYAMLEDNPDGKTKTLVFRYGNMRDGAMPLNEDYATPDWNNNASDITTVEFDPLFLYARPTTCYKWFYECTNLTEIKGIEYLNTSEVTDMNQMFTNCESIESLNLSSFNTAKVNDMYFMFAYCKALKSLDLSRFNTEKVSDMSSMFYYCSAIESLDLSRFNTEKVSDMNSMFYYCSAIEVLDLSSFNTAAVSNMSRMFYNCSSLKSLDLSSFNTSEVTNMSEMFYCCSSLKSLDLSSFNTSEVTLMQRMFYGCHALESLDLGNFNTENVQNMNSMFQYCYALESLDLSSFNTSAVENMSSMFESCESLESLNLSSFNTEKVTNMYSMFTNCSALKSLDLSSFNTELVMNLVEMFSNCKALKSLDLSSFNTARVKDMKNMFYGCESIESLDLSSFNTAAVTDMDYMFANCKALKSLDLSSFNTEKVQNMSSMFQYCYALESLDLSSFNTALVTDMSSMFFHCSVLKTILVGNGWDVDRLSDMVSSFLNMFSDCPKLVGGNGFHYEGSMNNEFYAVIDGKDGNPGYLTLNALTLTNENGKTTAVLNGDFADGINAVLIINKEIKVDALTFNRKFTNGVTATVMFPFGFTADNNIKGTFHTIAKVGPDKNGLWTAELSNAITDIKANTPYIFYPSEDIDAITFSNITLVPTNGTLSNGDANGWQLHGVYSKKIWPEDSKTEYGFAGEKVEDDGIEAGEFVLAGKDAWADPMRCYLTYAGSVNPFTAKAATVLPDRIRVVFPSDNDNEITTDPAEVITPVSSVSEPEETKVWSFGGIVYIEAQPDMDYTIIDLTGRTIKKGVTLSTREEVALSRHAGIVIVNINGKSVKVNL